MFLLEKQSSMKIARVIPILKPKKLKTNPEGYRQISNLHTIEKITRKT